MPLATSGPLTSPPPHPAPAGPRRFAPPVSPAQRQPSGYDWSVMPSRGLLRQERSEDEWKERRRAPRTGTKVRFIVPDEAAVRTDDPGDAPPDDAVAATPALRLTAEERRLMGVEDDAPGGDGGGGNADANDSSSDTFESDVAAIEAAVDAVAASYAMNPVTLTFTDPALEKAYVKFFTRHQGFIAGKIYAMLAGIIAVGLLFPYLNFEMTAERWGQLSVVVELSGVAVGWLMFGLMFLRQTLEVRELIFFLAVATHWPAFATGTLIAKVDKAYRYAYTTLCFMFCCFVAQPRFVGMFFFLTVSPIATCFIATFTKTHYWEEHSYFEMLYWVMPLFPLFMLRVFERRSREAFMENERGMRAMEVLQHRANLTRRIIARFFPLSASRRLLATGSAEQNTVYPSTALIVSNVVGFSEWAAQTSAELVVSRVATMFVTMERLGRRYGVEKVSTLGDMFFGAIFPMDLSPPGARRPGGTESTDSISGGQRRAVAAAAGEHSPAEADDGQRVAAASRSLNLDALRLPRGVTAGADDDGFDASQVLDSRLSIGDAPEPLPQPNGTVRETRGANALKSGTAPKANGAKDEDRAVNAWLTETHATGSRSSRAGSDWAVSSANNRDADIDTEMTAVLPSDVTHSAAVNGNGTTTMLSAPQLRSSTGRLSVTSSGSAGTATGSGRGTANESSSGRSALPTVDRDTADRCHRALRFATAVRHSKDAMALRIAVHCGSVIGGFVGIQPPKFDLFGPAVQRVKELDTRGRKRRIHASEEVIVIASPFGQPSSDFEPSDCRGQVFSSWRAHRDTDEAAAEKRVILLPHSRGREGGNANANGDGTFQPDRLLRPSLSSTNEFRRPADAAAVPVSPTSPTTNGNNANDGAGTRYARAPTELETLQQRDWDKTAKETEDLVQEKALVLCAYLQRFGERERDKALRGFDSRDALLKRTQEIEAGSAPQDNLPPGSPGALDQHELEQLEREMQALELHSDDGRGGGGSVSSLGSDQEMLAASDRLGSQSTAEPLLGDDEVLQIENPGDEKGIYKMDVLRMRFQDPKVEQQYLTRLRKQQFNRDVYLTFAVMTMYLLLADFANACADTTLGRLRPLLIGVYLLWHILYLYYVGTGHRYNILVVQLTYSGLSWASALMYDPVCGGGTSAVVTTGGNIIAMYFNQLAIAPTFAVDVWMFTRWAILIANSVQFVLAVVVRRAIWNDEVLVFDGLPLAFFAAFMFTSLFGELSLRSGFQATMRRRALHTNRSEHAERTAEALEMMLPSFVIEKLMRVARKAGLSGDDIADDDSHHSHESGATRLSLASALSRGTAGSRGSDHTGLIASDVAHSMLTRQSEAVWPYPRAVVMVVAFDPPVLAYDTIADTVMRVESVCRARSIQKVKSFGNAVQLVTGFDKGMQFQEAVVNALDAALEIQKRVFPPHLSDGWTHRIGIHCGPIFGAVIGTRGLSFDVYGDTVNTAAFLAQSTPSNTVRCSANVRQALPFDDSDLDFALARIAAPLFIKGKGHLPVYHVVERSAAMNRHGHAAGASIVVGTSPPSEGAALHNGNGHPLPRPAADDEEDDDEHRNPSEYAESIRSSLRTASMLPSAAAPVVANGNGREPRKVKRSPAKAGTTSVDVAAALHDAKPADDDSSDVVSGGAPLDTPASNFGASVEANALPDPLADTLPSSNGREPKDAALPRVLSQARAQAAAGRDSDTSDISLRGTDASPPAAVPAFRPRVFDSPGDGLRATDDYHAAWGPAGSLHYDDDIEGFSDEDD